MDRLTSLMPAVSKPIRLSFDLAEHQWSAINRALLKAFESAPGRSPEEALTEICRQWIAAKELASERGECININTKGNQ